MVQAHQHHEGVDLADDVVTCPPVGTTIQDHKSGLLGRFFMLAINKIGRFCNK
jgi:hypothetical protein